MYNLEDAFVPDKAKDKLIHNISDGMAIKETEAVAGDATNTGILGLLRHKQLCGRLIVMSLEWIGE